MCLFLCFIQDVVVCVKSCNPIRKVSGSPAWNINVIDDSLINEEAVSIALWGNWASMFKEEQHTILRVINASLKGYKGVLELQANSKSAVEV